MDSFASKGCSAVFILSASIYGISAAHAQTPAYPTKSIRMVIALAPGGGVDTTGRIIGQKLSSTWGQPVVADNRPGAGGTIAAEAVAHAAPDGYTLLMISAGITITPSIMKLSYDPAQGPAAGDARGHLARRHGGASVGAGEKRQGADRLRQSEARRAVLLVLGTGLGAAPGHRAVLADDRAQDDARALQGNRAEHHRCRGRTHRADGGKRHFDPADVHDRQAPCPGHGGHQAHTRPCRTCRPLPSPECRDSGSTIGTPCSCPAARTKTSRSSSRKPSRASCSSRRRTSRCSPRDWMRSEARRRSSPRVYAAEFPKWAKVVRTVGLQAN